MSELHWGLAGLSVIVVGGVYAYNSWQEYRHRKVAESVLRPEHDDVLLKVQPVRPPVDETATERLEPVFAEEGPDLLGAKEPDLELPEESPVYVEPAVQPEVEVAPQVAAEPEQAEPVAATADVPEPVAVAPVAKVEPAAVKEEIAVPDVPVELLDPRIEYIVAMEMIEAVPVRQILASQRETLLKVNKPVHWIGFNEKTREWQRLAQDGEVDVRRLRVGLQLVNRLGPVSEGDLAIFTNAMQALADELMAVADMPPSRVLDQAAEIDRFCAAVDLEIGLNLVSRGSAFPGTKIRALAEAAGMMLGADGLFTRYDDAGRAQFSLQNFESTPFSVEALRSLTTHGLTFLLDVPRVDHGERVFMQMTEVAKRFADTLQGALVDDNRQPLSDAQLDHIRREFIGKPQATMAGFGLAAGSPQALRLFS